RTVGAGDTATEHEAADRTCCRCHDNHSHYAPVAPHAPLDAAYCLHCLCSSRTFATTHRFAVEKSIGFQRSRSHHSRLTRCPQKLAWFCRPPHVELGFAPAPRSLRP